LNELKSYASTERYYRINKTKKRGRKVYSVQCLKTKRVIDHVESIILKDVTFKVSEAGRKRVLRDKQKNVHAFAIGEIYHANRVTGQQVKYNPYLCGYFYDTRGVSLKVETCNFLKLNESGAFYE